MIAMRLYHDGEFVFDTRIPTPAVELHLKTAVKMLVNRARTRAQSPFIGTIADIDIEIIAGQRHRSIEPLTLVPDRATVVVKAYSQKRPPVETWEID
jgi:hypothetical protein